MATSFKDPGREKQQKEAKEQKEAAQREGKFGGLPALEKQKRGQGATGFSQDAPLIPSPQAESEAIRKAKIRERNLGLSQFGEQLPAEEGRQQQAAKSTISDELINFTQNPDSVRNLDPQQLTFLQKMAARIGQTAVAGGGFEEIPLVSPAQAQRDLITGGLSLVGASGLPAAAAPSQLASKSAATLKKATDMGLFGKDYFGLTKNSLTPDILRKVAQADSGGLMYKTGRLLSEIKVNTKLQSLSNFIMGNKGWTAAGISVLFSSYLGNAFTGNFYNKVNTEIQKELKRTSDPETRKILEELDDEAFQYQQEFNKQVIPYLIPGVRAGLASNKKDAFLRKLSPIRANVSATIQDAKTDNKAIGNRIKILEKERALKDSEIDLKYQDRLTSFREAAERAEGDVKDSFDAQIKKLEGNRLREKQAALQNATIEILSLMQELNNIADAEAEEQGEFEEGFFSRLF